MHKHPSYIAQAGFTIIEMIVALAVFSVVVTISIGALLTLIATNQQLQIEQSVMTNLSFALDSMTREIRTGTHYFCETANNLTGGHPGGIDNIFDNNTDLDAELSDIARDCLNGRNPDSHRYHGIAFNEGGGSITGIGGRILYYFDRTDKKIFRRVGAEEAQSIVSSGIAIENAEFYVSGSEPLEAPFGEDTQAAVTIFIEAADPSDPNGKPYRVQTTVTQRTLDI
jgi:prepilin-type N-terminal cleavage/methylation domain-containing protein